MPNRWSIALIAAIASDSFYFSGRKPKTELRVQKGHFVLVVGFCRAERLIFYADPSCGAPLCAAEFGEFDAARRAFGTDEDLLFFRVDESASSSDSE